MSGATPPRPSGKQKFNVDPGPAPDPHKHAKLTQLIQVTYCVKFNWTRWASIVLKQAGKGYVSENIHARAIVSSLNELRTAGRRDIVLHGTKLYPSDQPNPMYQHFPGYGNRIDLGAPPMFCQSHLT